MNTKLTTTGVTEYLLAARMNRQQLFIFSYILDEHVRAPALYNILHSTYMSMS